MVRRSAVFVALFALFMAGCIRPVIMAPTNQEKAYAPTEASSVTISTFKKTDRPSIEVGYVFSQEKSVKDAEKLAREEASKMGGHAIVDARIQAQVQLTGFILFFPIYETFYFVHGTVVRYEESTSSGS
jgi:hypothetical protein